TLLPFLAVVVLLAVFPAGSLAAPPAPDSILTLPQVVVDRAALDARHRMPTGFATEVRVGSGARAFETLSEALGRVAGVHLVQYGGLGAFSTVSLRGAPPGR